MFIVPEFNQNLRKLHRSGMPARASAHAAPPELAEIKGEHGCYKHVAPLELGHVRLRTIWQRSPNEGSAADAGFGLSVCQGQWPGTLTWFVSAKAKMNSCQRRRIWNLIGVAGGLIFVCGGAFLFSQLLVSHSIRIDWPQEPTEVLSGGRAWLIAGATVVCGAGMVWSAVRQLRKGGRS